jgi:DNA-binding XRE family transcriptional regulator
MTTNPAMTPAMLKIWRRKHSVTQGELAELLGVHISTTHRWERGDVPIPVWLRPALKGLEQELTPLSNYVWINEDWSQTVLCLKHSGGETSAHATREPCVECARDH